MYFLFLPFEGLPLIFLILAFIIWIIGLVAVANGQFNDNTTKLCWFFIILFLNIIGILLFVFWGRKEVFRSEKN
ncbi:MAG: PLDc N-terminal domain-containing protein [Bacteroidota bacterium]